MTQLPSHNEETPSGIPGVSRNSGLFLVIAVVLTALAAGTGWGIRGQYGHESGAMLAGALASLTLVMLFVPAASSLGAARAAAMMTVAIGIGGSMTYGSTVGLTHDQPVIGNSSAYWWGMLGLFIKGGLWIGFGGVLLGMGLGGKRYRPLEIAMLMAGLFGLMLLGVWLINTPYDPPAKVLPRFYFSDNWIFEPDENVKPRFEIWGGYFVSLMTLLAYVRIVKGDRLAARMGVIAIIFGGLGFSCGQSVQAYHAWRPEVFTEGFLSPFSDYTRYFNWWNMMETTFGLIWGAGMAFGLWLNQRLIFPEDSTDEVSHTPPFEIVLCVAHVVLLMTAEFILLPAFGRWNVQIYIEFGLVMSTLPLIGIVGGRFWPYLMVLPIVIAPVAGKTLRILGSEAEGREFGLLWMTTISLPIAFALCVAAWLIYRSTRGQSATRFAATALLTGLWILFGLNTAVFDFAWPWIEWTGRTPNQVIFGVSAICLTVAAIICACRKPVASGSPN